ncbi:MAG: hypothetical protein QOI50_5769 [Pseudonocardiales bacterium]|jgi:hypothetical protein|nr:hypothetical protein [Pseudonocardiales bacterium]
MGLNYRGRRRLGPLPIWRKAVRRPAHPGKGKRPLGGWNPKGRSW